MTSPEGVPSMKGEWDSLPLGSKLTLVGAGELSPGSNLHDDGTPLLILLSGEGNPVKGLGLPPK